MANVKLTPEQVEAFRKMNEEALSFCSHGKGRKVSLIVAVIFLLILYFFWLPALNWQDTGLYQILSLTLGLYCLMRTATSGFYKPSRNIIQTIRFLFREEKVALLSLGALLLIWGGGLLFSSPIFFSQQYHTLLKVAEGNFTEDVEIISYDKIPMTDEQSAVQLGSRALGELSDLVSQFEVNDCYTQINLNGAPVRIAPLEYGNLFKWFSNQNSGLPGYVAVNMITQDATVVRTESGLRYSDSEPFFRNVLRYLRLKYPTYMFETPHLEIDENGHAWWICPHITKTIGLFGGSDVSGAVLVHAATGEVEYYMLDDIPQWVDQVFTAELILEQYNYSGKYGNGFWNSLLSQSGVTTTTEGANYIAIGDDVYLYTGITSAGNDQSNVGFILCNQRTKETKYYAISGATEQSAQLSAEGAVQHLGYTATFPLLLNIANEPTYFMALKDSANLAKKYAMVNVEQYQLVAVGDTVEECEKVYVQLLLERGDQNEQTEDVGSSELTEKVSGTVTDLRENVVDGVTFYYISIDSNDRYFRLSAKDIPEAVLLNIGSQVELDVHISETGAFRDVNEMRVVSACE